MAGRRAPWFETALARLLTMRAKIFRSLRPHPEEPPTGPRKARPDDRLRGVSKDGRRHNYPFPRRDTPELCMNFHPKSEGAGNAGRSMRP